MLIKQLQQQLNHQKYRRRFNVINSSSTNMILHHENYDVDDDIVKTLGRRVSMSSSGTATTITNSSSNSDDELESIETPPNQNDFGDGSLTDMSFCDSFFNDDNDNIGHHQIHPNPFAEETTSSSEALLASLSNDLLASNNASITTSTNKVKSNNTSAIKSASTKTTTKTTSKKATVVKAATTTKKKKKRVVSATYKFRPYQEEKWKERFEDLLAFRRENSHCLVPHTFPENPTLARWVKRQRYQYKLFQQKEPSSMTQERIDLLDGVGFVWHSHEVVWQERLSELMEYKKQHGDCLVPSNYTPNPKLATWVKCQRRQYKLHLRGSPSNITVERIHILEKAGFEWELRSSSYSIKNQIAAHQQKVKALKNELILPPPTVQSSVMNADLSCESHDDDEDPMAFLKNDDEQGTSSDEPLDLLMDVLNDLPEDLSDEEMIVDASTVF